MTYDYVYAIVKSVLSSYGTKHKFICIKTSAILFSIFDIKTHH